METYSEVFSSVVLLSEDGARRKGGGVNLEEEGSSEIGLLEGGVCEDNVNESVEGGGALLGPCEGLVFLCQGYQRAGDIGIVRDEWPLITQYSQYTSNFFHGSECTWPILECVGFLWVWFEFVAINDDPKIFYTGFFKGALGWSEEI